LDRGARKQNPQKNITPTGRIGADPCDTEHRLETSQGAGETREPRDQHGEQDMLNARACNKEKKLGEAKRRSAEKNKSMSISMEK